MTPHQKEYIKQVCPFCESTNTEYYNQWNNLKQCRCVDCKAVGYEGPCVPGGSHPSWTWYSKPPGCSPSKLIPISTPGEENILRELLGSAPTELLSPGVAETAAQLFEEQRQITELLLFCKGMKEYITRVRNFKNITNKDIVDSILKMLDETEEYHDSRKRPD